MKTNTFFNNNHFMHDCKIGKHFIESMKVSKHNTVINCIGGIVIFKTWKNASAYNDVWKRKITIVLNDCIICLTEKMTFHEKTINSVITTISTFPKK